jgi:hypothetical protein
VTALFVAKHPAGKVRVGLLVGLTLLAAAGYYGIEVGGVYWRRYKLEEAVKQDLGYAGQLTDEAIHRQLLNHIAGLGLPPEAQRLTFVRTQQPRALQVSISYAETVNLLFTTGKIPVSLQVRRIF